MNTARKMIALSYFLATYLLAACGEGYTPPTQQHPGPPQPACVQPVLQDGLRGQVDVTTLTGDVTKGCDGTYTCSKKDYCRIEFMYWQYGKDEIAPFVETLAGTVNISDLPGLQGKTTNGPVPISRLELCGHEQDFFSLYVSMSAGAKLGRVGFKAPHHLCDEQHQ